MTDTNKVIIVTNIFNGRYLQGKNIGHETINFIKAVDGKYYLWINSIGKINGKYENWAIDVVMVRSTAQKQYKVVGMATNCEVVKGACDSKDNKKKSMQDRYNEQVDLNIKYDYSGNKVPLAEVFKNNILNGKKEGNDNIFVSLKADNVYRPTRDIFITFAAGDKISETKNIFAGVEVGNMSQEKQRGYYELDSNSYKNLSKIIESAAKKPNDLWKEPNIILNDIGKSEMSVLEVAKKERDELAVSNMLAYFLSKYRLMSQFCSCLFKQNVSTDEIYQYDIAREKNNIDILIYGRNNIYIIENKIDSMVQVYDKTLTNEQIEKTVENICRTLEIKDGKEIKDIENHINYNRKGAKGFSQLSKYYIYALSYIYKRTKSFKPDSIHCAILMPYYSIGNINNIAEIHGGNTLFAREYKLVSYEIIKNFFDEYLPKECSMDEYCLVSNFKRELEILSSEFDNNTEMLELVKFVNRLKELAGQTP